MAMLAGRARGLARRLPAAFAQQRHATQFGLASEQAPNGFVESFRPAAWDKFTGPEEDHARRKQKARRELAAAQPLARREKIEDPGAGPTEEVQPAPYDPNDYHLECDPHAWEKVIQNGQAVPSDEFGRKTFILDAVKPDPETNLWIQILVDALEEAKADDIAVIDTTQKWMFFPDIAEYIFLDQRQARKIDTVIYASGETVAHIETIVRCIVDKGKKGLIPIEYSKNLKLDETKDSIFWKVTLACGKIVVNIQHPHCRDYNMIERKVICQQTEHAGRFHEDLLHSGGWVRVWDYWTPAAPCLPRTDYEAIYAKERSYGWERLDTLKPEYVVTDDDIERRRELMMKQHNPLAGDLFTLDELETLSDDTVKALRKRLLEEKKANMLPWFEQVGVTDGQVEARRAELIRDGSLLTNYTIEQDPVHSVTDEELKDYVARLKRVLDHNNNIMKESPETKARKDQEWAEYEKRRTARIRKFGYYDFVELSNDYHRNMLICPDGVYTWPDGTIPDINVQPHPENYTGKPRDTHWGPGWYDV